MYNTVKSLSRVVKLRVRDKAKREGQDGRRLSTTPIEKTSMNIYHVLHMHKQ